MNGNLIELLASEWHSAGVDQGDMLLVHSTMGRLLRRIAKMGYELNPALVIESFLLALGKSGTLILPLFNFDFTKGVPFDMRSTPSQMGALTEVGRKWPNAVRTGHPIYSFAIIGKNSELFRGLKNLSGYGQDSPFGIVHRLGGKIGVLDLPDQNSLTYYHYVEETLSAPYRYHKMFSGQYTDLAGVVTTQAFGVFVRNIELGVVTHVDPMGEILWQKGIYTGCRPKEGCGLRVASASRIFDEVALVLQEGRAKGLLYEIQK